MAQSVTLAEYVTEVYIIVLIHAPIMHILIINALFK